MTKRLQIPFLLFVALILLCATTAHSTRNPKSLRADRYYLRVSSCDDGGRAYINGTMVVDVGFDEDSNWLDITQDLVKDDNKIKFEVKNKTGAITYSFQVKKNESMIYEESCGTVKVVGCENNRAFRIGVARAFTYLIKKPAQRTP
jgi:hypothetical protein